MQRSKHPSSTLPQMAAVLLLFLPAFPLSIAGPNHANISTGSFLFPTNPTSWRSPSGLFSFGFYEEGAGFRVGIWLETGPRKTIVWTANRDDPPLSSNASLALTTVGLRLRSDGANDKLISGTIDYGLCSYASMLDSGNFVLYDVYNHNVWKSFDYPTDTILGGQTLSSGKQLFSSASESDHSTGRFRLAMQQDSNLVLYPVNTTDAYWSTDTSTVPYTFQYLHLYEDGYMYLVNKTGSNSKFVGGLETSGRAFIHRATLDADGIFRLYSHSSNGSIMRPTDITTDLEGTCRKGFCGVNSYCELANNKPNCFCPPGYDFINSHRWFVGCHRNLSIEGCLDNVMMKITYNILSVENIEWDGHAYNYFSLDKAGCSEDCLNDCDCDAAVYKNGTCEKFNLPLMYGKKNSDTTLSTAFFKVGRILTAGNGTGAPANPRSTEVNMHNSGDAKNPVILIIAIVLVVCLIVLFAFSGFLIYKVRARPYRTIQVDGNLALLNEIAIRSYSYNDLIEATDNFKEELGRGGFGAVYKGSLYSKSVAVKRLEKVIEEGEREFRAEMRAIGRTHHKNLVRLLGFCDEGSSRLLVYEYMSNGSLANLLFKSETRPEWRERVGLALDVARGIYYLHEECHPHIIHCDIKPQNILMDEFWTAKISDFGLAKLLMPDQTRTITVARGTRGYLAPEWQKNVPISVKTDVYSFGVVLLEIVCCRRNIETEVPDNEIVLSDWVYICFVRGQLQRLVGGEEVELRILDRMAKVGLWCIQEEPALRPSMKTVILMLEGNLDVPIPPCPTSTNRSF